MSVAAAGLMLCACDGGGQSALLNGAPPTGSAAGANPADPDDSFGLAAPSNLKQISFVAEDMARPGWRYEVGDGRPAQRVERNGAAASFTPQWAASGDDPAGLAYALYPFILEDYDLRHRVQLTWGDRGAVGECYIGLANWANDRWTWFGLPETDVVQKDLTDFIHPETSLLLVMVLLTGEDSWELNEIRVGDLPENQYSASGYVHADDAWTPLGFAWVNLSGSLERRVRTDSTGRWVCNWLTNGNYTAAPEYFGLTFSPAEQGFTIAGASATVDPFSANAADWQTVSGMVVGTDGQTPMSGVGLRITSLDQPGWEDWTTSGLNGGWSRDLPDGIYRVAPIEAGWLFDPQNREFTVAGAAEFGGVFAGMAAALVTVDGYIYRLDGMFPLQNVKVELAGSAHRRTYTDAEGHWSFADTIQGEYELRAELAGWSFTPAQQTIQVGAADLSAPDITGEQLTWHKLQGFCYDSDGVTPLVGVDINIEGDYYYRADTDINGYWELFGVWAGDYRIEAWLDDYRFSPAERLITLSADTEVEPFIGRLLGEYSVSGNVYDADGVTPLADIDVNVDSDVLGKQGRTNEFGFWQVDGLPEDAYSVRPFSSDHDFSPVERQVVITDSNLFIAGFTAIPRLTADVFGVVMEDDGVTPIEGVQLRLSGESFRNGTTDVNGAWFVADAYAGDYTVRPVLEGYRFLPESREIHVAGDGAVEVEMFTATPIPRWLLGGTIRDADGVTPLMGIDVHIDGYTEAMLQTNALGNWLLLVFEGSYTITPDADAYHFTPALQTLTVTAPTLADDFLGTARDLYEISGVVLDDDHVTPLPGVFVSASGEDGYASTQTGADGSYVLSVYEGIYEVRPSMNGLEFHPSSRIAHVHANVVVEGFYGSEW